MMACISVPAIAVGHKRENRQIGYKDREDIVLELTLDFPGA